MVYVDASSIIAHWPVSTWDFAVCDDGAVESSENSVGSNLVFFFTLRCTNMTGTNGTKRFLFEVSGNLECYAV